MEAVLCAECRCQLCRLKMSQSGRWILLALHVDSEADEGFHSLLLPRKIVQSKAGVDIMASTLSNGPYMISALPFEHSSSSLSRYSDDMIRRMTECPTDGC